MKTKNETNSHIRPLEEDIQQLKQQQQPLKTKTSKSRTCKSPSKLLILQGKELTKGVASISHTWPGSQPLYNDSLKRFSTPTVVKANQNKAISASREI